MLNYLTWYLTWYLTNYLLSHNFISTDQLAFRKQHLTQTALHRVVDDWLESMDNGEFTTLCMFDFRTIESLSCTIVN